MIEAVEERAAPIDLLIVDEAHHCRNPDTKQHRVVRALSESSDATLLLTATPIHLGDENLFNLLRLLLPEEFDKFGAFRDRLEVNRHIVEAEASMRRGGDDSQGHGRRGPSARPGSQGAIRSSSLQARIDGGGMDGPQPRHV
ncbi:MAG: hypothetical protein KF787_00505 [Phycisphaeraceae bacterium]|nr:hypothetical protein [Phycisphaeraceae bacterium]